MQGIYVHIPFCRQACSYCDFHFSTSLKAEKDLIYAIATELGLQRNYLPSKKLDTLYFGGGTPSIVNSALLGFLVDSIANEFEFAPNLEFTLEANPDDLTKEKIRDLLILGVNRLSIGVQSFNDADLRYMNRAHTAQEADRCVKLAQDMGITNLSIDLIYGTPTLSDAQWQTNLEKAISLGVNHISSYALTVEPKTALYHQIQTGKTSAVDEAKQAAHFAYMVDFLEAEGFEHYEISNFARVGHRAVHNSGYWVGMQYLGLGPSAHSFNGINRHSCVKNNALYISELSKGNLPVALEELTETDRYNEYVMTALRTIEGVDLGRIETRFGSHFVTELLSYAQSDIEAGKLLQTSNRITLAKSARFMADGIASNLFIVN